MTRLRHLNSVARPVVALACAVVLAGCRAGALGSPTAAGTERATAPASEVAPASETATAPRASSEAPPLPSSSIEMPFVTPSPAVLSVLERSDRFWDPLTYHASGYWFRSLGDMAEAADLVVTGRLVSVRPGRHVIVSADDPEATADFVTARVAIDEVLKGTPESRDAGQIDLELFLPDPRRLDEVVANVPQEQQLLFLVNGAASSRREGHPPEYQEQLRYTYIGVSAQGILRNIDGNVKRLPPAVIEDLEEFPTELDGADFDEIVDRVRQVLRRQE